MADLRALFETLGYTGVRTLLNSGNVVFTSAGAKPAASAAAATQLAKAVAERFGFAVPVTVITAAELAAIVADHPLGERANDPSRILVAFVRDPPALAQLARLAQQSWGPELLTIARGVGYCWCPGGVTGGALFTAIDRALSGAVTTRNWATLVKLDALAGAG